MPISFSLIPEHLRVAIIQKKDIRDFPNFCECSRGSYCDSDKIRSRFVISPLKLVVEDIDQDSTVTLQFSKVKKLCVSWRLLTTTPVRITANKLRHRQLTSEVCDWTIDCLMNTNSSFGRLKTDYIRCSSEKFNDFFRASRFKNFSCFFELPIDFLRSIDQTNITEIDVLSSIDDADLPFLKIPKMYLISDYISNFGINCLLKEWFHNTREIEYIKIMVGYVIECDLIFDGIQYFVEDNTDDGYSEAYSIAKDDSNRLIVMMDDAIVHIHHVSLK